MNKRYAILAGLTLLAASSAFAQPAAGEGLAAIRAAGVLKCGVGFEFKPFSFTQDPKTRQLVGYDVDICNAIAAKIGVKPELVPITGATRVTDLQSGRTDIALANLTNNPERARVIDFSNNYFAVDAKVMVPSTSPIKNFADMAGKRMSGVSGAQLEIKVPRMIQNVDLKVMPSPANAFLALEQGKVDAMAADETALLGLIGAQQGKWRILDESLDRQQIGIGVRKGEPHLLAAVNDTLTDLEKSGKAAQIFDQWFGAHSDLKMKRAFTFAPYKQP